MQAIYLYFNALLYVLFALWCTLAPENTATNIGFARLTPGGRSEYLVVYGGLQAGLALIFFLLARASDRHRLGILISIALYAPLVVYRISTVLRFWPVSIVTLATGALEIVLLVAALGILVSES